MEELAKYMNYSLQDIEKIPDENIRAFVIEQYNKSFANLTENRFMYSMLLSYYGISWKEIVKKYENFITEYESISIFQGEYVKFYPSIRYLRSKKTFSDDIGSIIERGELYCEYRPLLWNMTTNYSYVLKKALKVEMGSEDLLPTNLKDFEALEEKILYSHEPIYEEIRVRYDNGLVLKKLKK